MRHVGFEPEELRHMHHTQGLTVPQMAVRLGVAPSGLYIAMERFGIELHRSTGKRTRPPLADIASKADVQAMLKNKHTVIDIAQHYGYTPNTVYNLLDRYGLEPPGNTQKSFRTTDHLDRTKVRRYYNKHSLKDTAAHFDLSINALRTYMKHHNITMRKRGENLNEIDPAQVRQRYANGEGQNALARSYRCSTTYIRKCLGLDGHTPPDKT